MVESIVLHPALLIAAGFECLTTRQVRFLNAYRRHYDGSTPGPRIAPLQPQDFDLGGRCNPHGRHHDPKKAFMDAASITRFPYLNEQDIYYHYYQPTILQIWREIHLELFLDMEDFCLHHRKSRDFFRPITSVIYRLRDSAIYHKVSALHQSGLGDRQVDTFRYFFDQFKTYDRAILKDYSS